MVNSSYILITGGSSGIGLETAKLFASKGFHLLITSLDAEELKSATSQIKSSNSSISVAGITIDLSKDGSVQVLYDWAKSVTPRLDIVINNAGFGTYGFIDDIDIDRELDMINLMVKNLYISTRLFLHDMLIHNHGTIINISSISAFQPNPTLATYGAAKAFVYQFTRAINTELKNKKSAVKCISINPTPVRTNFQNNSGMQKSILFDTWLTVNAAFVAKEIYRAYVNKIDTLIPGRFYGFISAINKRMPEMFQIWLAKKHLN
ncbi:MAG TPA: SDR family NAD(P)-dependent oxidoreductase [Saprospiraceae bacterium]|nr:SDR family NAD(P)-dependent oxidoreductase [Saprospiraceae bacterium]